MSWAFDIIGDKFLNPVDGIRSVNTTGSETKSIENL